MNTDLMLAATAQLATIMAAVWVATEAIGNSRPRWNKLWLSLFLGPAFSTAAYELGFFSALPAVATIGQIAVTGLRGLLAAAFAGLIATLLAKAGHDLVIRPAMDKVPPPGPPDRPA